MTDQNSTTKCWHRWLCRMAGHKWHRAGILTDAMYRSFWIVKCSRCGADKEDALDV